MSKRFVKKESVNLGMEEEKLELYGHLTAGGHVNTSH